MNKTFIWQGVNRQGHLLSGEIEASCLKLAQFDLSQQGINIQNLKKKSWLSPRPRRLTLSESALFFRQFATLIQAGITLLEASHILLQDKNAQPLRPFLQTLATHLAAGKNLSQSMRLFPQCFDRTLCQLTQIGETGGKLETILLHIAKIQEAKLQLSHKIKQAFIYPSIVFCLSLLMTLGIMIFIVPQFESLFHSFHHELPALTRVVLHASQFCRYTLPKIVLIIFLIFLACKHTTRFARLKTQSYIALTRSFLFRRFVAAYSLAQFTRLFAILNRAGVPILESLTLLADLNVLPNYQKSILRLHSDIAAGLRLSIAMLAYPVFSPRLIQMIKVGEESGNLDSMLEKTADIYEQELQREARYLSQLLEPLIIVFLGVLIGGLVIALYLPIFKLGTVF